MSFRFLALYLLLYFLIATSFTLCNVSHRNSREIAHNNSCTEKGLSLTIDSLKSRNDYIAKAYQGLCLSMMAKYPVSPIKKLRYFTAGKKLIEKQVSEHNNNLELRYIRLMVQLNAPAFLGYNEEVRSDLSFVRSNMNKISLVKSWKYQFIDNLMKSKYLAKQDSLSLKKLKESIK